MMFSSNACSFVLLFLVSLSANAETIRGVRRELQEVVTGEAPVDLGSAGDYTILTKAGISTVPTSAITGDIAVSPIAATAITGFSLSADAGGQFSGSTQVVGKVYAASYGGAVATHLTTAVSAMETAYTNAAGRTAGVGLKLNLGLGHLGGSGCGDVTTPLTAGVYTFGSDVTIDADITFNGSDTDILIIQMVGDLLQVAGTKVNLSGGALATNIFWQVAGFVDVEEGAHMKGILLVKTKVMFETSASLSGRILAQTACTLDAATISHLPWTV
jgi:hypothetical protein